VEVDVGLQAYIAGIRSGGGGGDQYDDRSTACYSSIEVVVVGNSVGIRV